MSYAHWLRVLPLPKQRRKDDMKFETNLRAQDKKTIGIVLYVAVIALFSWYLIRPAWIKLGDLDDKLKEASSTRQENQMKSINLGTAEVLYSKAVTDIDESTKDFYDVMDNSEIEKMGTEYVLNFGLMPVDFIIDIRDGSAIAEVPYLYSGIESSEDTSYIVEEDYDDLLAEPTEAAAGTGIDYASITGMDVQSLQTYYTKAVNGATSTIESEVQCAKITIVVSGKQAKCQALIDDITKNPSIRVTGFSWSDAEPVYKEDEAGNRTILNYGQKTLRLDLNFYMTDKPQFEQEEG